MSFAIMQTILKRNSLSSLNKMILIKNLEKENSNFVKARTEGQTHCNCNGMDMENSYFKFASISENVLITVSFTSFAFMFLLNKAFKTRPCLASRDLA